MPVLVPTKFQTSRHGWNVLQYTHRMCERLFVLLHDDVIKWKHFPRNWPFVRGIHRSPVNSPHKGQWRGALMFSLICFWINIWVNNREVGDFRRHRAHYDATAMLCFVVVISSVGVNSCDLFTHILQGNFTGTRAIVCLPLCHWTNSWRILVKWSRQNYKRMQQSVNRVHVSLMYWI